MVPAGQIVECKFLLFPHSLLSFIYLFISYFERGSVDGPQLMDSHFTTSDEHSYFLLKMTLTDSLQCPLVQWQHWRCCCFLRFVLSESVRATRLVLPLYLKNETIREEDGRQPYRELSATLTVQPPCIVMRPPRILLTPVPLGSQASALITLLASGYPELVPVRSRSFAIMWLYPKKVESILPSWGTKKI